MFNPMMGSSKWFGGQQQDSASTPMNSGNRGMASGRNPGNHYGMGAMSGMGGRIGNKIAGRASAMSSRNVPPTGNFGSAPPFSVGPEMNQSAIGPDKNFMQNAMSGASGMMGTPRLQDNRTTDSKTNPPPPNMFGQLGSIALGDGKRYNPFGGGIGMGSGGRGIWNPYAPNLNPSTGQYEQSSFGPEPQFYQDMISRGARF